MIGTAGKYSFRGSRLLLLLPFLGAIFLLDVASVYNMSYTIDERAHLRFGRNVIEGNLVGASMQKMPVTMLNYLASRALDSLGLDVTKKTEVLATRLPSVFASLVLAVFVFLWSERLYGRRGALLSLALYTFCPTVLAHSRLATTDIYCACLMSMALFVYTGYLRRPLPSSFITAGIVTGLAQATKSTALLLFPLYAILWLIKTRSSKSRADASPSGRGKPAALMRLVKVLGFLGIVGFAINSAYLYRGSFASVGENIQRFQADSAEAGTGAASGGLVSLASRFSGLPVPLPKAYVQAFLIGVRFNARGEGHAPVYLLGKLSKQGWWYYFPVAFGLKTPLALFGIILVGIVVSRAYVKRNPLDELGLASAVILTFAFFTFFCSAQIGVRYLLPILPLLYVFVGKVAVYEPRRFARHYKVAMSALVLWFSVSALSFHPHYIAYFNELIGDRKNMYKYLADSNVDWGQSTHYLQDYLERHRGEKISLVPNSPVSGKVIVGINTLVGVFGGAEKYRWLRDNFKPVDHIGYAMLIYDVPEEESPSGKAK